MSMNMKIPSKNFDPDDVYEEDYRNPQEDAFTFGTQILRYMVKIGELAAVELRGGYWQTKTQIHGQAGGGSGVTTKVWVPDTREVLCNGIMYFYDLLYPEIQKYRPRKTEIDYRDGIKQSLDVIDKARRAFLDKTAAQENEVLPIYKYNKEDQELAEEYMMLQVRLHRELFRQLNAFANMLSYFRGQSTYRAQA